MYPYICKYNNSQIGKKFHNMNFKQVVFLINPFCNCIVIPFKLDDRICGLYKCYLDWVSNVDSKNEDL